MAKSKANNNSLINRLKNLTPSSNFKLLTGVFFVIVGLFIGLAILSFIYNWQSDASEMSKFWDRDAVVENHLGKVGAIVANFFVYKLFGIASIILAYILLKIGVVLSFSFEKKGLVKSVIKSLLLIIWLSVTLSFVLRTAPIYGGVFGFELNEISSAYLGDLGLGLVLFFTFAIWFIYRFDLSPNSVNQKYNQFLSLFSRPSANDDIVEESNYKISESESVRNESLSAVSHFEIEDKSETIDLSKDETSEIEPNHDYIEEESYDNSELEITVEVAKSEEHLEENLADQLVEEFGEFDPELDLPNYKFPELRLLKDYGDENINIDRAELEQNKNKIVETLNNYKIEIAKIKATIGPTVTLYEIIPAPGVRISKIKNLEDDIALSLSALGIRIIAPIPGKGTIGIEVPNKKPTVVSMRSVLSSTTFQNNEMDLPIALGKTISNTTFVADLTKMPHLLVAGATGQGKSVGLNAIMASLLYKKHPSELKFVLVDPKKVELTLFNKIERHYLAKLPDSESAIITDTTKVINTLNSLCIEMDDRYDMLKNAMVRTIKEYNQKFKQRKLNPNNGHKYLPYIVLIIDEFADLIMTAGKEVETPIARLAQLARAVGIHLIVATQRPSVNVITGIIKANFPARIAFRVTSKIDSRTILDEGGANQLIGKGDMLYSSGNDMLRLQCAFVDTPEIENLTNFIGEQKGYADAYHLPEFVGDDSAGSNLVDLDERDPKFEEAARLIISAQQGSASLLQRKLKLGYNRAGRIVDQLEAAGIIGPFEGSKARQVLIQDEASLQAILNNLKD